MLIITPIEGIHKGVSENSPLAKPQNFFAGFCAIWQITVFIPPCRKNGAIPPLFRETPRAFAL
jgi:hypothetical protein